MIVYIYDHDNKEFLWEYKPQRNPKNPKQFLLPRNATTIKPLKKKGLVPVFENGNWVYKEDYRDQNVINLETKEIIRWKNIGDIPEPFMLYEDYQNTDEYLMEQNLIKSNDEIENIKMQISELDLKRIRAFLEPSIRDDGVSWLDYYTNQIVILREKIKELS